VRPFLYLALAAASSTCALCQTASIPFLDQLKAQLLLSGLRHSIITNGTANWVSGSTHEAGPAKLTARTDGSFDLLLALDSGTRADSFSPLSSRNCQWVDKMGKSHAIAGASCYIPLPWFSPIVLPTMLAASNLVVSDGGEISEDGGLRHVLSVSAGVAGSDPASKLLAEATRIAIHYDPVTLLPTSVEYGLHPDGDDSRSIPVKVLYRDYRPVASISVPFRIERYVNRTPELTVVADSVLVN